MSIALVAKKDIGHGRKESNKQEENAQERNYSLEYSKK